MSIEHFRNWWDSIQVEVILYIYIYIIVKSHNNAYFSETSANFRSVAINNIAGLLELTVPPKTFFN